MKKKVVLLILILIFSATFAGCGNGEDNDSAWKTSESSVDLTDLKAEADMFTSRDYEVGYSEGVDITLSGDTASCESDSVKIEGTKITITADGTYVLSGTLNDGMIVVDAEETSKPQIVLNNVNINSEESAAIYVLEADKVFVTLAKDSQNSLSNGGVFETIDDNNIDGTIFSKQDIVFNGNGKLTVNSPSGHGVVSKDDVKITSGTYTINSASHGIEANDSVRIASGNITIDAGKDAIRAENEEDAALGYIYIIGGDFNLESEGDGISASSIMQIEGGSFNILAGGGSVNASKQTSDSFGGFMGGKPGRGGKGNMDMGMSSEVIDSSDDGTSIKGLKSSGTMYLDKATFTIDSADDTVHSNGSMVIKSGTFNITSGDDGFHADETLAILDGNIDVTESYEGVEGLNIEIYGGDIHLDSSDDGINAAGGTDQSGMGGMRGDENFGGMGMPGGQGSSGGSIKIEGGNIYIKASGDGIDSNGTLDITGGYVEVCGPTNGDTAVLDYDTTGTINGGTFVGSGAYMMAQTLESNEQGVLAVSVGSQSGGTLVEIKDKDGKLVCSFTPELSYQIMIYSSPDIVKGETYTISVGSISGQVEAS